MREYEIAVLGGDGIGPEVVREGVKVLSAAGEIFGFSVRTEDYPYGTEHFLATGEEFPDHALRAVASHDAILLGAIGDPRVEVGRLERAIIAGLRFGLSLYVNLRPVQLFHEKFCPLKGKTPADIDFVVVRENTEGAYSQVGGIMHKGQANEVATQTMLWTRVGVERVIRYAFDLCRKRDKRKKLMLVDKANAIRAQDIWTRVFAEVAKEYPDVETDHGYVDAACMWMIKNPESFDTVVTTNLFGDIITDLAATLQGGLGVAASGNIHPGKVSMFEPIHGSAPKYAGKNVANPIATVMAVSMMLDYLGETEAGARVEGAVRQLLVSGKVESLKAGVHPTDRIGDWIVETMQSMPERP